MTDRRHAALALMGWIQRLTRHKRRKPLSAHELEAARRMQLAEYQRQAEQRLLELRPLANTRPAASHLPLVEHQLREILTRKGAETL